MSTPSHVAGTRPWWDSTKDRIPVTSIGVARLSLGATLMLKAFAAFIAACVLGLTLYGWDHTNRLYEGVRAGGVNVGGLSEAEATAKIEKRFAAYLDSPIQLTAGEEVFTVTPRRAGARLDAAGTAQDAFAAGRSGSYWSRTQDWARAFLHGQDRPLRLTLDAALFDAELARIAPDVIVAPANATIQMNRDDVPTLSEDRPGVSLDVSTTRSRFAREVARMGTNEVPLALFAVQAEIPAELLAPLLAEAQTAVDANLLLTVDDVVWRVSANDLRSIVSVSPDGRSLDIARGPVVDLLTRIAAEMDQVERDAAVTVNAAGDLVVVPAVNAARVDVGRTTDGVIQALRRGEDTAPLIVDHWGPPITDEMAATAALEAEALVDDGLKLGWEGGEGSLTRDELIQALIIDSRPGESLPFRFDFDTAVIAELLTPVLDQIDRAATDARFRLIEGRVTLVGVSAPGRAVDLPLSTEAIRSALLEGKPSSRITISPVVPEITAGMISRIQVPDVLGDSATYYGESSDPRRQNVERASTLENGWLIPPGGIFSYNEFIGEIDAANGFVTGYGIVADEEGGVTTAPVIGGGVCQVSTTIFQAAFWAGFPIVERYQHPYWLPGYGQPPRGMVGLDAMINIEDDWALDMKFENTTGNWIAVVLIADGVNVSAQVLGTDPGWLVEVREPAVTNVVAADPKMYYTDSPELPAGEELIVERAQEGFDVAIERIVTLNGEVIESYTLESTFAPARNTTLRGTRTT